MPTINVRGLAIACALTLPLLSTSCWYAKQAARFLGHRAAARPVQKLVDDTGTDERLAVFLERVEAIRAFSVDEVGLRPTKNYTSYVTVDRDYLADVVSACAADSFTRYYWTYPFLGPMPYKGFYDRADAEAEAARLRKAGLDVMVRHVDAFSSLGFFRDPLFSFMVDYPEGELAELIVHESAHATLFLKGQDRFNEEFATFVGRRAADLYVAGRFGADSPEATARRDGLADRTAFVEFLKETARLLSLAYDDPALSREDKLDRKAAVLAERAAVYRATAGTLFKGDNYRRFDMGRVDNAYLDLYRLYEEDLSPYERWLDEMAGGSLREFVRTIDELAATRPADMRAAMLARLDGG